MFYRTRIAEGNRVLSTTWLANADSHVTYGAKAANLSYLIRHSFRVPNGFCVATDEVAPNLSAYSAEIERFASAIDAPLLAVRSSALDEDSAHASYAGVFRTRLNVRPALNEILTAIEEVVASQNSPEAEAYRFAMKLPRRRGMAVIVQEMLDASLAGVLFTRNPLTGERKYLIEAYHKPLIINGSSSDTVHYVVDPRQPQHPVDSSADLEGLFSTEQVVRLAQLGNQCEQLFGYPVDIEWAEVNDELWILQCRPITAMTLGS